MKDPKRLLADRPTDLERLLLSAAREERPSPEHRIALSRALRFEPRGPHYHAGVFVRRLAEAALALLLCGLALVALCAAAQTALRLASEVIEPEGGAGARPAVFDDCATERFRPTPGDDSSVRTNYSRRRKEPRVPAATTRATVAVGGR